MPANHFPGICVLSDNMLFMPASFLLSEILDIPVMLSVWTLSEILLIINSLCYKELNEHHSVSPLCYCGKLVKKLHFNHTMTLNSHRSAV